MYLIAPSLSKVNPLRDSSNSKVCIKPQNNTLSVPFAFANWGELIHFSLYLL